MDTYIDMSFGPAPPSAASLKDYNQINLNDIK